MGKNESTPRDHATAPGSPRLIVFAGLPGVGKSTLARSVSDRLKAVWLRVDTIEASLLRAGIAHSFETGLAAYLAARDLASDHLGLGRDVVIDAVNGVEPAREMWRELAKQRHAALYVIEVTCSDTAEHRRRVESQPSPTPPLPSSTWDEVLHREYHPWTEPVLSVDGALSPSVNLEKILDYLT